MWKKVSPFVIFWQTLIELICDVKSMEEAVCEMQYDAKKAPLGKLTKDQIKAGYAALKKIDACVDKKDFGSALTQACDEFYTRIPHDFGFVSGWLLLGLMQVV